MFLFGCFFFSLIFFISGTLLLRGLDLGALSCQLSNFLINLWGRLQFLLHVLI